MPRIAVAALAVLIAFASPLADGRVGTLRAGLQADLLLVDGRPDEDIAQIGKLDLVFRDGIAYDPVRLRESVRGKVGR